MLEIFTNIIIAIISSFVTLMVAIISTRKKADAFLKYIKEHWLKILVIGIIILIFLFMIIYLSQSNDQTDENLTNTLINQIKHDTQEFTLLNLKYSQITAQKDSLQNSYFLVRAERDSLANLIALKQNQKADITRQIDRKQDEKSKLNEQLRGLDARNVNQTDALKLKINQLEIEIQTLKTQKERLEKEIEGLEREKKGLNNKIEALTKSLANSNRERQKLELELKKANTELATRVAESDSVLRILAAKPGQFKQTHQIAWSPDRRWLAILFTSRKISRLLVFDAIFRNLFLDSLIYNSFQTVQFTPDGKNILADQVIINFRKKASAGGRNIFRSYPESLNDSDLKNMFKRYDFYCHYYDFNKNFCYPLGHGFVNQYQLKIILSDKVSIDWASCLMWQQAGSENYMNFEVAKKWIENLNQQGYAGYKDWRLPSLEEAMSLMEPEKMNSDLHINPIFDNTQWDIWTADLVPGSVAAWAINFKEGSCYPDYFYNNSYVRAVRSVQSLQE